MDDAIFGVKTKAVQFARVTALLSLSHLIEYIWLSDIIYKTTWISLDLTL